MSIYIFILCRRHVRNETVTRQMKSSYKTKCTYLMETPNVSRERLRLSQF